MRAPLFVLLAISLLSACEGPLGARRATDSPVAVFETVHRDFREYYGLFAAKGIDWDDAHARYRPLVSASSSDAELYDVLVSMLGELDDAHVTLYPATNPELPVASVDLVDGVFPAPPFDEDVVLSRYLVSHRAPHPVISYGRFDDGVGYLHLASFDGSVDDFAGPLDDAIRELEGAPALIVDIRDNAGGFDPLAQYVAGRFAEARHLYMSVRKRNGPALDAFTDPVEWFVEPTGSRRFVGPIVVLTTYGTQSAAETFLLAMRELPHVTQIGQTTSGAFSDNIMREAGNGWAYTISVGDYRDARGASHEGIGLVPEVESIGDYDLVRAGRDKVIEDARAWIDAMVLN